MALFETLLTVSGIGPKVAMGFVSSAPADTLRLAIAQGNLDVLTAIPGIGKKTAQRLVLELKGKIDVSGLGEVGELTPVDEEVMNALDQPRLQRRRGDAAPAPCPRARRR